MWSEWENGECSVTCGDGKLRRTRRKIVEEKNNGACTGSDVEDEECNERKCPGNIFETSYHRRQLRRITILK